MTSRVALALVLAAACSRSEAAPIEQRAPVVHEQTNATAAHDDDPIAALARTNRTCEACHPIHAEEWRASKHRNAFTDEAFATAYERTPFRFCRDCHAPHAKGTPDDERLDAWVVDNGVACVGCHVPEVGERVGTSHPLLRPIADDASACAGCHEFRFPDAETLAHDETDPSVIAATLMQRTLWEHARSPFADTSCATCHMPEVGGENRHRDHRFAHDDERLRAAITVTASRSQAEDGSGRVVLELAPVGVGHAFPTGDLFRRLELKVEGGNAVARRYLARHFPPRRRGEPYVRNPPLEADDRLVAPTRFVLDLPGATNADTLTWSVTYQRVDHRVAENPDRSTLHGQVVLAQGVL